MRVLSNGVTGSHVHFNRITLGIVLEETERGKGGSRETSQEMIEII